MDNFTSIYPKNMSYPNQLSWKLQQIDTIFTSTYLRQQGVTNCNCSL
jgi:hypothetical protein